jgi:RNA polymerase sigma-70 factor (ECF subfamily)
VSIARTHDADPAVVERARRGDREAFDVLVAGSIDRLYALARLIVRDADLAEDAVQIALVKCWQRLPELRDVGRFDAWLNRLLVNAAIDQSRSGRVFWTKVETVTIEPSTPDAGSELAERDRIGRGLERLRPEHRVILVLYHYLGLSMHELSETLGIPVGTAKSRLHYATEAMRAALDAEERAVIRRGLA